MKVEPSARVEVVQRNMTALLRSKVPNKLFHLRVDPNSITVLSVGEYIHPNFLETHMLTYNKIWTHKV